MSTVSARVREQFDDAAQQFDAAKLGMWAFLATEILLFGALFCVYACYRHVFPAGFIAASRRTDVVLGTLETCVLLTSSMTMALAIRAMRMARPRVSAALTLATVGFGIAFLVIHGIEYVDEYREHLFPGAGFDPDLNDTAGSQLSFVLYYVMTALHALHVSIGIAVLTVLAALTRRGRFSRRYYTPLELGGLYWHLVDIVWIFLYPLFYLVLRA